MFAASPVPHHLQGPERETDHVLRQRTGPRKLREHEAEVDEDDGENGDGSNREQPASERLPDAFGPHQLELLNLDRMDPRLEPPGQKAIDPAHEEKEGRERGRQHHGGEGGVAGTASHRGWGTRRTVVGHRLANASKMNPRQIVAPDLFQVRVGIGERCQRRVARHDPRRAGDIDGADRIG